MSFAKNCKYCSRAFTSEWFGRQFCSRRCHYASKRTKRTHHQKGYMLVRADDTSAHRRVDARGRVLEHLYVAEIALGHPLPPDAVVHHVNGNPTDNAPTNLVICENTAYHQLLHRRQRIVSAGGNPDIELLCGKCKTVKPIAEFYPSAPNGCRICRRAPARESARLYRERRKASL